MSDSPPINRFDYDEVVIRLRRQTYYDDPNAFQAEIRKSPFPLHGGAFRVESEKHLESFRALFQTEMRLNQFFYDYTTLLPDSDPQIKLISQKLETLGKALYEILPVSIRAGLPHLFQRVFERGRGVRLVIEARAGDRADRLLSLPWELVYLEESRIYPGRSPRLIVVRRLLDSIRHSPLQLRPPLNLVHVIADSSAKPILPELQQVEREIIPQAIQPGSYRLVETPGSVEGLSLALQHSNVHIVHFLGHGEQPGSPADGNTFGRRGYIRFINQFGQPQMVTGERLQLLLSNTPGVQVVVLNACQGAAIVASNIATDLVYSGFPYVITMQSELPQAAAQHFIEAFYAELQRGQPVDYAVAAGRFAIAARLPGASDWCLPVLYTSQGLAETSPAVRAADQTGFWWGAPNAQHRLSLFNVWLAIAQLAIGVLLLLSEQTAQLPTLSSLLWATLVLVPASPLITFIALRSKRFLEMETTRNWPRSSRLTFWIRSWGSASVGLSLVMFYTAVMVELLAGLGFWEKLPPWVQLIALTPMMAFAIFNGYSLIFAHGLGHFSNDQVERIPFTWGDFVIPIAGYMMLWAPVIGLMLIPDWLKPPLGNLILGGLCLIMAYALRSDASNRK